MPPTLVTEEFRLKLKSLKSGGTIDLVEDVDSGIAHLILNHPAKRNCISGEMMLEFTDVVRRLEQWTVGKGVLLCGEGPFFCSGGNLTTMKAIGTRNEGLQMARLMNDALTRFSRLHLITAVLIEGRALGGGAELTTAADFRLMADNAKVEFVHMRMGVLPAWGGTTRLTRLVGPQLALDLVLSGRALTAEEALKVGFAAKILHSASAKAEALQWLKERTKGPANLVHAAKQTLLAARDLPHHEALGREIEIFAPFWGGDANREALSQNIKH